MKRKWIPIKITKVTSNDDWPLIYLPLEARRELGIWKKTRVLMSIDRGSKSLIITKV